MKTCPMPVALCLSLLVTFVFALAQSNAAEAPSEGAGTPAVIRNAAGWPLVFELSCGDEFAVERAWKDKTVKRTLRLVSTEESWEPDYWALENPDRRTLREVRVAVEIDGRPRTLLARPYQMPVTTDGLRIYVESTRTWARDGNIARLRWYCGDVRFSVVAEGEPWGPENIHFPIGQWRWRANTYNNTWLQLVPYNLLYYHHGHDAGAVPDIMPVRSMTDGVVVSSPVGEGAGRRRGGALMIEDSSGLRTGYYHINNYTVNPRLTVGTEVKAGDVIAKTGMTSGGYKAQEADHHLHVGLLWEQTEISTYPFMVESYMRDYDDDVLAIAGGWAYGLPGDTIRLDASRSVAREGRTIANSQWRLHDGRVVDGVYADVAYDKPGLYSETLIVRADNGAEDHDYIQVRIYNTEHGRKITRGWIYHTPVRGIVPGTVVTIENRLTESADGFFIDFGDGTEPQPIGEGCDVDHVYMKPGIYDVSVSAVSVYGEPAQVRMRVVVESLYGKGPDASADDRLKAVGEETSVDLGGGVVLELVRIQPGTFVMGEEDGGHDEKPMHSVTITKPFYLGKYEVTQAQWRSLMGDNPSVFKGESNPVENVSWNDCREFLGRLNKKLGGPVFRMPTEAEWEYACRAGTTTLYSFGDSTSDLPDYCWFVDNSQGTTHPVGTRRPSPWGLYDMHGNVWEWCEDLKGEYAEGDAVDPLGVSTGSVRVRRGGSWTRYGEGCRAGYRSSDPPTFRHGSIGLRVARDAK